VTQEPDDGRDVADGRSGCIAFPVRKGGLINAYAVGNILLQELEVLAALTDVVSYAAVRPDFSSNFELHAGLLHMIEIFRCPHVSSFLRIPQTAGHSRTASRASHKGYLFDITEDRYFGESQPQLSVVRSPASKPLLHSPIP